MSDPVELYGRWLELMNQPRPGGREEAKILLRARMVLWDLDETDPPEFPDDRPHADLWKEWERRAGLWELAEQTKSS